MSGYTFIKKKASAGLKTSVYVRKTSIVSPLSFGGFKKNAYLCSRNSKYDLWQVVKLICHNMITDGSGLGLAV